MRYRSKPATCEAEQWLPGKIVPGVYGLPGQGVCPCYLVGGSHDRPHVMTAHGQIVYLAIGDWVIAELDGHGYYPCKPDVFALRWEEDI